MDSALYNIKRAIEANCPSATRSCREPSSFSTKLVRPAAGYLRPNKRLMVDVITSKQTCSRALDIANELFLLLEERGYSVAFERHGLGLRRYPTALLIGIPAANTASKH